MLTTAHHPCQALADLLTLRETFGTLEGLRVAYVGDGNNVARSLALIGSLAGVDVVVASPAGLRARGGHAAPTLVRDPARGGRRARTPSTPTCGSRWATSRRRSSAGPTWRTTASTTRCSTAPAPSAIALHDLPAHPGEEITAEVLYGPRQRIWDQAENRRHAQKALLEWLLREPAARRPARRIGGTGSPGGAATDAPVGRRRAELRIESLAFGGAGVARTPGGYVVFVAGGVPGRPACARACTTASAPTRRRARSSCSSRGPDRVAPLADHPGAPWQVLPYARQLEIKQQQVDEALRRIGTSTATSSSRSSPAVAAVALPQQARVLVRRRRRTARCVCGFHAPGSLGADRSHRGLPARLRARQPAARARCSPGAARRAWTPFDRRARRGLPAQPRRARGPAHRPAPGASVTGPGELDARLAGGGGRRRRPALDAHRRASPRRPPAGRPSSSAGVDAIEERLGELDLRISPEAFFQTNTEMAERLYGLVVGRGGAARLGAGLSTSTAGSARSR